MPSCLRAAIAQTICCALLLAAGLADASAQPAPVPARVHNGTTGVLPNGLTYRIETGETRGNKIALELVVKAGMLEAPGDPQLSHVVEHIVYEKLDDVVGKGSIYHRLARLGGVRGQDSNAVAGILETHYFIRIPADDEAALAAGLEIVAAWMRAGNFTYEEIDRGRKTVIAEERGGSAESDAYWNIRRAAWFGRHPQLGFQKAPMTDRDATPDAVRSFHRRLYHPANMAVVISGPINPDAAVNVLRERFSDNAGMGAAARPVKPPVLRGGHYWPDGTALSDKPIVEISYLYRTTMGGKERARDTAVQLLADRLFVRPANQLSENADGAIVNGGVQTKPPMNVGSVVGAEVIQGVFTADPARLPEALEEAIALLETVHRDGFASADFEAARAALLTSLTAAPSESASERAERWRIQFSDGREEPDRAAIRAALTGLTVAEFNDRLRSWLDPKHRDIFINAPREIVRPDQRSLNAIIARAASMRAPLQKTDSPIPEPVLASLPAVPIMDDPVFIRDGGWWSAPLPKSGATFLYRQVSGDRVRIYALRRRAISDLARTAADEAAAFGRVNASGLGGIAHAELTRYLAREGIEVRPFTSPNREGFSASGPADKLLLMQQVARTYLTNPQCDRVGVAEGNKVNGPASERVENLDTLIEAKLGEVARSAPAPLDSTRICTIFHDALGDVNGMVIAVEGPMAASEAYAPTSRVLDIAGEGDRPSQDIPELKASTGRRYQTRAAQGASADVAILVKRPTERAEEGSGGDIAMAIVRTRLMERLRSKEKGIYSLESYWRQFHDPDYVLLSIRFTSLPTETERLIGAARQELERLRQAGAGREELAAARGNLGNASDPIHLVAEQRLAHGRTDFSRPASDSDVNAWLRANLRPDIIDEFIAFNPN